MRPGTLRVTLLSIALAFDAFVVFFTALTLWGVRVLDAVPALLLGLGGTALLLFAAATIRRWSWVVWLGWALQIGIVWLWGLLAPIDFIWLPIGLLAFWAWGYLYGGRIDRRNLAIMARHHQSEGDTE